jgi:hypothetical protein
MLNGIRVSGSLIDEAGEGQAVPVDWRDFPSLTEARGGPMFLHNSVSFAPEVLG